MEKRASWFRSQRGIATSLIEATLVIAITAILTSVAFISAADQTEAANFAKAKGEVKLIGASILSFIQDNGFPPAFKAGQARTSADPMILILESEGFHPNDPTGEWKMGLHDQLTNHLVHNAPGKAVGVAVPYPLPGKIMDRFGEIVSRFRGWNGPYMSQAPGGDPWGDKYLANVGLLTPAGRQLANELFGLPHNVRPAVFVMSAGPNQSIETAIAQPADSFATRGDDLVFRIQ